MTQRRNGDGKSVGWGNARCFPPERRPLYSRTLTQHLLAIDQGQEDLPDSTGWCVLGVSIHVGRLLFG